MVNPFSTNVPLLDKPGSWFLLGKCLKNTCGRVTSHNEDYKLIRNKHCTFTLKNERLKTVQSSTKKYLRD